MWGDSEFQASGKLAYSVAGLLVMDGMRERGWDFADPSESIENNFVSFATSPDDAAACPNVRGKTRTRNQITKGKSSQHVSGRATFASLFMDKDVYAIGFEVKAGAAMRVQDEPFDADAEVATKKILEIDASAPGMIACEVLIKGSIDGVAFRCTLVKVKQVRISGNFCAGHGV